MLFVNILLGILLLIISIVTKLYPPKGINQVYGYRTKKSMLNEDTWREANAYSTNLMIGISVVSIILGLISYATLPETIGMLVTYVGTCALLVFMIILTERHLSFLFDKAGNRKKESTKN